MLLCGCAMHMYMLYVFVSVVASGVGGTVWYSSIVFGGH